MDGENKKETTEVNKSGETQRRCEEKKQSANIAWCILIILGEFSFFLGMHKIIFSLKKKNNQQTST